MKIAVVKPDYKIIGGFEIVLDKIVNHLINRGHIVEYIKVDMTEKNLNYLPYLVSQGDYTKLPEFFDYINQFFRFQQLKLPQVDLVISTQPPSFAVDHPNHISILYHQHKIFYDLSDLFIEVGFADNKLHNKAAGIIRETDSLALKRLKHIIAGSYHIKNRLESYNQIKDNVSVFYAGIDDDFFRYNGTKSFDFPVCIGRHEFPKRPDLFINAMKYLPELTGRIVGTGGRTIDLKRLDTYLTYQRLVENKEIADEEIWKKICLQIGQTDISFMEDKLDALSIKSNIIFTGRVNKQELIREYANALCVTCPAFEEDYGLTAIEAMAFGKPTVACRDGGGYTELIEHGVTGFIVEPEGKAIAEVFKYLSNNPDKRYAMSIKAYEKSRLFSWENGLEAIDKVIANFS